MRTEFSLMKAQSKLRIMRNELTENRHTNGLYDGSLQTASSL
jgi:hypothetical protein